MGAPTPKRKSLVKVCFSFFLSINNKKDVFINRSLDQFQIFSIYNCQNKVLGRKGDIGINNLIILKKNCLIYFLTFITIRKIKFKLDLIFKTTEFLAEYVLQFS